MNYKCEYSDILLPLLDSNFVALDGDIPSVDRVSDFEVKVIP